MSVKNKLVFMMGQGIFALGSILMISFACVLILQTYIWLRQGAWPHFPASAFFHRYNIPLPHSDYHWAQKIIAGIMGLPFAAWLLVIGTCIMCWGEALMKIDDRDW